MTLSDHQLGQIEVPLWFCLKAAPKQERLAAAGLKQLAGVQVFAPQIRFRKTTRRGPVWFVEALFPGYVFARFFFPDLHRQVIYVPGISSIVRFGKTVAVVDDDTIGGLRQLGGEEELIILNPELKPGDSVEIATGPFLGLTAVVTQVLPARERVKVLLEFLGRSLEAEISEQDMIPSGLPRSQHGKLQR
jgi:transcriptional antiterminator RfaH